MEFREFVNLYEKIQTQSNPWTNDSIGARWQTNQATGPAGALPTQVTGSQWGDMPTWSGGYSGTNWQKQDFDLGLPNFTQTGKVLHVDRSKNPIRVLMQNSDGKTAQLYIPFDVIKKMNTPPEKGRTLMVTFQRRTDDTSPVPSKIDNIKCY